MGSSVRVFRLLRATGEAGCEHYVLLRAGRPSYPNADQGADDAAEAFPMFLMDALAAWWERCVLPAQCRWAGYRPGEHELVVVADPVDVVGSGPVDLHEEVGMRSFDVWIADRRGGGGAVLAVVPDAAAFRTSVEEAIVEEEIVGEVLGAPECRRVLLLAEGSGDGDLRDI